METHAPNWLENKVEKIAKKRLTEKQIEEICFLRAVKHLTYPEIAKSVNVSVPTIYKILKGNKDKVEEYKKKNSEIIQNSLMEIGDKQIFSFKVIEEDNLKRALDEINRRLREEPEKIADKNLIMMVTAFKAMVDGDGGLGKGADLFAKLFSGVSPIVIDKVINVYDNTNRPTSQPNPTNIREVRPE